MKNIVVVIFMALYSWISITSCKTNTPFLDAGSQLSSQSIRLINTIEIPYNDSFEGTVIGGLSSIEYDRKKKVYYLLSDDRSTHNPSRFYTIKIEDLESNPKIIFQNVTFLKSKANKPYPSIEDYKAQLLKGRSHRFDTQDPEELRIRPRDKHLVWTSEGERIITDSFTVLEDPSIQIMTQEGRTIMDYQLPRILKMQATESGPRANGTFEGMSFSPNGELLFVSMEKPIYDDGAEASLATENTWCRIFVYRDASRSVAASYAYPLDNIKRKPNPINGYMSNGISSILTVNDSTLLVVEREYVVGYDKCNVRLYKAVLSKATNINKYKSLKDNSDFIPISKELLYDFSTSQKWVDNIEGITLGPKLKGNRHSLILISDNNFSKNQKQIIYILSLDKVN